MDAHSGDYIIIAAGIFFCWKYEIMVLATILFWVCHCINKNNFKKNIKND